MRRFGRSETGNATGPHGGEVPAFGVTIPSSPQRAVAYFAAVGSASPGGGAGGGTSEVT